MTRRRALATDAVTRAGASVFVVLLAIYLATLAPRVTFWDAGEFVAAVESFGVPHPPGTPLYVTLARAWRLLFGFLPAALAVNALSAVATALACAMLATVLARRLRSAPSGAAGGLTAGLMSSVWLNATEAEVYAATLLLSSLILGAGLRAADFAVRDDPAGAAGARRWRALLAYAFALAAPLHASALVAAPAAAFAAVDTGERWRERLRPAAVLGGALLAAGGMATGRWTLAALGLGALLALAALRFAGAPRALLLLIAGVSPLAIMLLRARFDPSVNQGDPATLAALGEVVARRQYAIAPLWPRQAPPWLQVANVFQYADWQVALGVAPETTMSVPRLLLSLAFVALGIGGARAQRRADPGGWRAFVVLLLSASIGVVAYLNLSAGPSIGWGILPDGAPHEARERDYFFVLAFWCWGAWAGIGAVALARRFVPARQASAVGLLIAALPAALNWRVMDRRREPDASAAAILADALLRSVPPRAVLVVWGDNDTYPLWEAQRARGVRDDVLVVTSPLLGARWMREELVRRAGIDPGASRPERAMVAATLRGARAQGRPVALALTVPAGIRAQLGGEWRRCGLALIEPDAGCAFADSSRVARFLAEHPPTPTTELVVQAMLRTLQCVAPEPGGDTVHVASDSLAQSCNAR